MNASLKTDYRLLSVWLLTACLMSCIPVEDFGPYWEQGIVDPGLKGGWKSVGSEFPSQDQFISFAQSGDDYLMTIESAMAMREELEPQPHHVRSLVLGDVRYLMIDFKQWMKDTAEASRAKVQAMIDSGEIEDDGSMDEYSFGNPEETMSGLVRYEVCDGALVVYQMKEGKLGEAIEAGNVVGDIPPPSGGEMSMEMPSLKVLDETTVKFLEQIADDPQWWGRETRYERVASVEAAVEESRTYPVQDAAGVTVDISLPAFQQLVDGHVEMLQRYLQASPEWYVQQHGMQLIATRRQPDQRESSDAMMVYRSNRSNGFWSNFGADFNEMSEADFDDIEAWRERQEAERFQIRYLFRFAQTSGDPNSIHSEGGSYFLETHPLAGLTRLKLYEDFSGIESYLAVGEPSLWFEFFEQTKKEDRIRTREALAWLEQLCADLMPEALMLSEKGYAEGLMPAGSLRTGEPFLQVVESQRSNRQRIYDVWAWVNPGRQGFVYLKFVDPATGEAVGNDGLAKGQEFIGWSGDENTLFQYHAPVQLRLDESVDARLIAELWFHPSDGTPTRAWFNPEVHAGKDQNIKLLSTQVTMEPQVPQRKSNVTDEGLAVEIFEIEDK